MWKCPKCGREFIKQNQNHYCDKPQTIDEYIAGQDISIQPVLGQLREVLRQALPGTEERISWSMPTFWDKHNIIHFAAFKKHIGIYPGPAAIEHFARQLQNYKTSKGAIQLPYERPLPLQLIAKIAKWCHMTGNHH